MCQCAIPNERYINHEELIMTKNLMNVQITVKNLTLQEFIMTKNCTNVQNMIKKFLNLVIFWIKGICRTNCFAENRNSSSFQSFLKLHSNQLQIMLEMDSEVYCNYSQFVLSINFQVHSIWQSKWFLFYNSTVIILGIVPLFQHGVPRPFWVELF